VHRRRSSVIEVEVVRRPVAALLSFRTNGAPREPIQDAFASEVPRPTSRWSTRGAGSRSLDPPVRPPVPGLGLDSGGCRVPPARTGRVVSGIRARLAGDLESQYDKVLAALEEAMDSTKRAWAFCPKCRTKVQVDQPDHGARIKAVELWLEQGFGRPGTGSALEAPAVVGGRETLGQLEAMSMEELAAYVWASQSEEERTADRRLVEELGATEFPPGFAEALERVARLSSGTGD
jgi:hypothetical protein